MFNLLIGNINEQPYSYQLLVLLSLCIAGYVLGSTISIAALLALGIDIDTLHNFSAQQTSPEILKKFKVAQALASIILFIIPAMAFSYAKTNNRYAYLQIHALKPTPATLALLITLTSMPIVALAMAANQQIDLPSIFQPLEDWLRGMETEAANLTEGFLTMNTPLDLLVNMFIIAVLPAIGEEMLFRGGLQQLLQSWLRNPHKAIWLSAIIFSAFHFQFYGFVPRMLLGSIMGYLFYWSGNLSYAILAHFVNNGLQVLAVYVGAVSPQATSDMPTGTTSEQLALVASALAAAFIAGSLAMLFRRQFSTNTVR